MKVQIRHAVMLACAASVPTAVLAAAEGGLEEVVITAQKRTERLSDVPVAASVLSADTVTKQNAGDISDLNRLVPSVQINGTINGRVPLGVRGIQSVSNEGNVGIASGVAIMIDGVPIPSDSRAYTAALEDAQSVEVLKGPQATLGGRTAAQGVINVVTYGPTDTFQGNLNLVATDDHEYRANGHVSGPLSDTVEYSLAGYYSKRDYPIINITTGKHTNQDVKGLRAKLLIKPTDNLDIKLTARVGSDDSTGFNFVYTHTTPGAAPLCGLFCPPWALTQAQALAGITTDWNNNRYASPVTGWSTVKDTDVSLDVNYRFANGLSLGSNTAYMRDKTVNVQDLFAVNGYFWNMLAGGPGPALPLTDPAAFGNTQTQWIDTKQLTEEIKLTSPADQKVSYVVGLFYSDTKIDYSQERLLVPAFDNYAVTPTTKTTDLYGRFTFKLASNNALVAGLRYNYDQLTDDHTQFLYTAVPPAGPTVPPIIFAGPQIPPFHGSYSDSTLVGDLSFQHKYADGSMSYVTYARGYAPAAYNTVNKFTLATDAEVTGASDSTALNVTDPVTTKETIDHFELGSKVRYLDGRLNVNAALFYTVYKNFQVQIFDQNNVSINPPLIMKTAGKASTKGLEFDAAYAATSNLRLDFSGALIDAKFDDYKGAPCYYPSAPGATPAGCSGTPATQDLSGKTMPNSPKIKLVLGAEQRIPLGSDLELALAGNYSWRDKAQMLVDQNPYGVQPAFGILNLSVSLRDADGKRSVTFFCNNVTDDHYYTDVEDFWSAPMGGLNTIVSQPARDFSRYMGVRASVRF